MSAAPSSATHASHGSSVLLMLCGPGRRIDGSRRMNAAASAYASASASRSSVLSLHSTYTSSHATDTDAAKSGTDEHRTMSGVACVSLAIFTPSKVNVKSQTPFGCVLHAESAGTARSAIGPTSRRSRTADGSNRALAARGAGRGSSMPSAAFRFA